LPNSTKLNRFEDDVVQHLDAAYNLARWLTRNSQDAEDVVQEAYLRAYKYFDGFRGSNTKPWLLTIVRNTAYTWLQQNRSTDTQAVDDDELNDLVSPDLNPEKMMIQSLDKQIIGDALAALPIEYREVLILRELEELSYKEIADIADLPVGTVMSRLSRARKRLQQHLTGQVSAEAANDK
jgi:RNA polymerase sigma factor, sigma-70 family